MVLYLDEETVKLTIEIRKNTDLKIPDAVIVAQARQNKFTLATADKEVLSKIKNFSIIDPFNPNP